MFLADKLFVIISLHDFATYVFHVSCEGDKLVLN